VEKIRKFISENVPTFDISPEREKELVEKLAQIISRMDLEIPALMLMQGFYPIATVMSYTAFIGPATFLELIGIRGYEYVGFLGKKENVKRLVDKLEELSLVKKG
jgi:hypothetical protein